QADTIAVRDLPGNVVEKRAVAERLAEVGKLDHAAGAPSAFDAAASTCGTRNGFVRYPATPRLTASIALDSVEKPVMMITGRSALYRFASRITVRPSMPGILRSAMSRSYGYIRIRSSAERPSGATSTSYSASASVFASRSRMLASSSTTSTRGRAAPVAGRAGDVEAAGA